MMKNTTVVRFRRLLRFSGIFNITAAFLFIIPGIYENYLTFFNRLNTFLHLGGNEITVPSDIFHALFIHTAGIDLVLIGTIVLLVSSNPLSSTNRAIILCNGIGRSIFALIVIYYGIAHGLIGIFIVIGGIDLLITAAFVYYLMRTRSVAFAPTAA